MVPQYDAVIVGAGFGGMGAAIQLQHLGYRNLLILDREDDLGGTWHVNRYPGLAVDIPSSTCSYSFEPNPHRSRLFAPGQEIKRYAEHVADKYDLRKRMRFGTTVVGAAWHGDHWRVVTAGGNRTEIDVLVPATGFNLWDINFPAFQVLGREGRDLGTWWRQHRFRAYEGVTVPGFPNLLSLYSPYAYSGLSYFTHHRANVEFLRRMRAKVTDNSVFALGRCVTARSYYFNQHGEATLLRPTSTINAHRAASRFPLEHYTCTSACASAGAE